MLFVGAASAWGYYSTKLKNTVIANAVLTCPLFSLRVQIFSESTGGLIPDFCYIAKRHISNIFVWWIFVYSYFLEKWANVCVKVNT